MAPASTLCLGYSEKCFTRPFLETTMCLQLVDQTLSFPKGILKNLYVRVGTLYVQADFVVIETGTNERAPIILGRPFLNTSRAVIYASAAKISFYMKGRKETFSFKNKTTQISEQSQHEPRKGPTGGTGTSKCRPSQLRWSLQFKEVKIVDLSHSS